MGQEFLLCCLLVYVGRLGTVIQSQAENLLLLLLLLTM